MRKPVVDLYGRCCPYFDISTFAIHVCDVGILHHSKHLPPYIDVVVHHGAFYTQCDMRDEQSNPHTWTCTWTSAEAARAWGGPKADNVPEPSTGRRRRRSWWPFIRWQLVQCISSFFSCFYLSSLFSPIIFTFFLFLMRPFNVNSYVGVCEF